MLIRSHLETKFLAQKSVWLINSRSSCYRIFSGARDCQAFTLQYSVNLLWLDSTAESFLCVIYSLDILHYFLQLRKQLQFCLFSSSMGILDLLSVICPNSGIYSGDTSGKISCIFQSLMCLNNIFFSYLQFNTRTVSLLLGLWQCIVTECRNLDSDSDDNTKTFSSGLCILGTQVPSSSFHLLWWSVCPYSVTFSNVVSLYFFVFLYLNPVDNSNTPKLSEC